MNTLTHIDVNVLYAIILDDVMELLCDVFPLQFQENLEETLWYI